MKKATILLVLPLLAITFLAGCSHTAQPMNEEEQATSYGLSLEQYREEKQAAARMNMTIEEHMKMLEDGQDMDSMEDHDMDM